MSIRVGVLALQGASEIHAEAVRAIGGEAVEIRKPADLQGIDALILPGGESTTMSFLLESSGLFDTLQALILGGMPTFGTCAGMILLASTVLDGRADQRSFGAIDITVRRNGYGRQIDSFESDLAIPVLGSAPFPAVFIRAPLVESVGDDVEILATVDDHPVLARQGSVMVSGFHPELSADFRLHKLLLDAVSVA